MTPKCRPVGGSPVNNYANHPQEAKAAEAQALGFTTPVPHLELERYGLASPLHTRSPLQCDLISERRILIHESE
jgi:hypothetical protein